jgi:nicotinic acid phosphoribosyltransferase
MVSNDPLKSTYRESLALLTDFYELTMAYGYWKKGMADREAAFHLFFRRKPFNGGFAIAAGLEIALDFIENFHYSASDLAYLEQLKAADGSSIFEPKFLEFLSGFSFKCQHHQFSVSDCDQSRSYLLGSSARPRCGIRHAPCSRDRWGACRQSCSLHWRM